MPIIIKIDLAKIDRSKIFTGKEKNGHTPKYIDVVLIENRDGADQFGNDGFASQGVSQEERQRGVKGPILGNWKHTGGGSGNQSGSSRPPQQPAKPSGLPFKKPAPKDPDLSDETDIPF
jgi:hypothetical protein